jgi:hypothetical protein
VAAGDSLCQHEAMRLVVTTPVPVVSLAAVFALAAWASLAPPAPVAPIALDAEIVSAVESVVVREQVRAHREPELLRTVWQGNYVCAQGVSAMTLTIDVAPSGAATARYDFGPVESNPTVPRGAFTLVGSLQGQAGGAFTGELEASKWILHPDGYFMVALSIQSRDGRRLRGKSHHETCEAFEITRVE